MTDGALSAGPPLATDQVVAILQLQARYGYVLDDQAWDELDQIFTLDVEARYNNILFRGLAELRAFFESANASSAHHASNVYVHERDGEVRVRSKFFVPYTRAQHEVHRWAGGEYSDVVVPTPAGWRIHRRETTARWQLTLPQEVPIPDHRRTW